MKSKLFLLVVLCLFSLSVNAQSTDEKPFKIGAGAMIGLPVGDVTNVATLAFGVDVMGEYAIAPSFGLTLSLGYVDFALKSWYKELLDAADLKSKMGMIPFLVGGKYNFSDKFYGSLQAGLSFGTSSDSGTAFTFAPGVGYKISDQFDLLIKYQSASKNGGSTSFFSS